MADHQEGNYSLIIVIAILLCTFLLIPTAEGNLFILGKGYPTFLLSPWLLSYLAVVNHFILGLLSLCAAAFPSALLFPSLVAGRVQLARAPSAFSCPTRITGALVRATVHDISPSVEVQLVLELKVWVPDAEIVEVFPCC
jgi:hypothetical protein